MVTRAFSVGVAVCAFLSTGCGSINFFDDDDDHHEVPPYVIVDPADPAVEPATPTSTTFEGYVQSAFAVTVDGVSYPDMEAFYTAESRRLRERVREAGYDQSWTATFEATLGLADLWRDMSVYVSPTGGSGHQGVGRILENGRFAVSLPAAAEGREYRVRANKRISVLLRRGEEVVRICYNFAAIEQGVALGQESLPVILEDFSTMLTSYACQAVGDGLAIPRHPSPPARLALGRTKGEVATLLGTDGLAVVSTTEWCWAYRTGPTGPCALDNPETSCDCQVLFDEAGRAVGHEGISAWALPES